MTRIVFEIPVRPSSATEAARGFRARAEQRAHEIALQLGVEPDRLLRGRRHCTRREDLGRCFLAYVLREVDGLPYSAIAEIVGTSHVTAIKRVRRAKAFLQHGCEDDGSLLPKER